jgi:hypothetical protein
MRKSGVLERKRGDPQARILSGIPKLALTKRVPAEHNYLNERSIFEGA